MEKQSSNVEKQLMVDAVTTRLAFLRKHPEAATGSELQDLIGCAQELFKIC